MERIDKLLTRTGQWSRKECQQLIRQGRVWVNGVAAAKGEEKICPNTAQLTVDGQVVDCADFVYLMLHKPAGVLSATEDKNQKTVLDLLPAQLKRRGVFPVGRLDKDSEGLLILTDDGALAHNLLSPRKHVDKEYYVRVEGELTQEDTAVFAAGMELESGERCLPAQLKLLPGGQEAVVVLREGKYHQIKRMLGRLGKPVTYLKRLSMGGVYLDEELPLEGWRPLRDEEIQHLKNYTGE